MKNTMNLKSLENMQTVSHTVADLKISKKNRECIATLIQAAFVNGYNAALSEKCDIAQSEIFSEITWLVNELKK